MRLGLSSIDLGSVTGLLATAAGYILGSTSDQTALAYIGWIVGFIGLFFFSGIVSINGARWWQFRPASDDLAPGVRATFRRRRLREYRKLYGYIEATNNSAYQVEQFVLGSLNQHDNEYIKIIAGLVANGPFYLADRSRGILLNALRGWEHAKTREIDRMIVDFCRDYAGMRAWFVKGIEISGLDISKFVHPNSILNLWLEHDKDLMSELSKFSKSRPDSQLRNAGIDYGKGEREKLKELLAHTKAAI